MIRDQQPKNRLAQLKQGLKNVQRGVEDRLDEVGEAARERRAEEYEDHWHTFMMGKDW